jgi:hypothetical protein
MKPRALIFLGTASLIAPDVVSGQDYKPTEVRQLTRQYADCVVRSHHRRASEALLADVGNGEIFRRYDDLIDGGCLGSVAGPVQAKFGGDTYRYALAEALVNADFAKAGPSDFSDRLPLAHLPYPDRTELDAKLTKAKKDRQRKDLQDSFDKAFGVAWMSRYGECIARRDPVGSRYWLLTKPEIPEELSRINALRPAFTECLEGGTLKFGRSALRGTVAINYYRLAMATQRPDLGKAH